MLTLHAHKLTLHAHGQEEHRPRKKKGGEVTYQEEERRGEQNADGRSARVEYIACKQQ